MLSTDKTDRQIYAIYLLALSLIVWAGLHKRNEIKCKLTFVKCTDYSAVL